MYRQVLPFSRKSRTSLYMWTACDGVRAHSHATSFLCRCTIGHSWFWPLLFLFLACGGLDHQVKAQVMSLSSWAAWAPVLLKQGFQGAPAFVCVVTCMGVGRQDDLLG